MKRSIEQFIRYKNNVEMERPNLTASERLITIDGIDGSGKSTIAKLVYQKMLQELGSDNVVLADITNLHGSEDQDRLKRILKLNDRVSGREDDFYSAGVNRAYDNIIVPAIESGKFVIVDRSEIDLLRFAIESGNKDLINRRFGYINDGSLTHRYLAGNRVFVDISSDDAWDNLRGRGNLSKYDPHSLEEVQNRIAAQNEAEKRILDLDHEGDVRVIRITNKKQDNNSEREAYLVDVVNSIYNKIMDRRS